MSLTGSAGESRLQSPWELIHLRPTLGQGALTTAGRPVVRGRTGGSIVKFTGLNRVDDERKPLAVRVLRNLSTYLPLPN